MKLEQNEPSWKKFIDLILIIDLFLVIFGSIFFLICLALSALGKNFLINFFQLLWQPIFIPAIVILISASLFNGLISWWQRQLHRPSQDKEI